METIRRSDTVKNTVAALFFSSVAFSATANDLNFSATPGKALKIEVSPAGVPSVNR
jgi:hypothetical protein